MSTSVDKKKNNKGNVVSLYDTKQGDDVVSIHLYNFACRETELLFYSDLFDSHKYPDEYKIFVKDIEKLRKRISIVTSVLMIKYKWDIEQIEEEIFFKAWQYTPDSVIISKIKDHWFSPYLNIKKLLTN